MIKHAYEYRINKKGSECFRSRSLEETRKKLAGMSEKRPGIYSMQSRSCRLDRNGMLEKAWNGKPAWSIWMD